MALPIMMQISDQNDLTLTIATPGKYSPDIIDDVKRRLMEAYREVLKAQAEFMYEETTTETTDD
jgi:hypothetical protein